MTQNSKNSMGNSTHSVFKVFKSIHITKAETGRMSICRVINDIAGCVGYFVGFCPAAANSVDLYCVIIQINAESSHMKYLSLKRSNKYLKFIIDKIQACINMSRVMRKPDFCLGENKGADQLRSNCEADQHRGENKGADQLRSNCEADQRLCFRNMDNTVPLLSKSKIPSL